MLLMQSAPTKQKFPELQAGQVPPPQSRSVSAPFFTPSLQVGAQHARDALAQRHPQKHDYQYFHFIPVRPCVSPEKPVSNFLGLWHIPAGLNPHQE